MFPIPIKTGGDRSLQDVTPKLWNNLLISIRLSDSVDVSKRNLITHLFVYTSSFIIIDTGPFDDHVFLTFC